jgi:hypothetical protein
MAVQDIYSQMVAGLTFLSMILFLKLLRYNKTIQGLALMFKRCWDDLIGFGLIFFIFFVAFVSMFYVFFFERLAEWHTFLGATGTAFSIMLGKFDFSDIRNTNIVAAVFFFIFNVAMSIIMINLMLSIIIMAFQEVELEMSRSKQDFEIVPYLMMRMRLFLGLNPVPSASTVNPNTGQPTVRDETNIKLLFLLL